jgi:hypothetical protein
MASSARVVRKERFPALIEDGARVALGDIAIEPLYDGSLIAEHEPLRLKAQHLVQDNGPRDPMCKAIRNHIKSVPQFV